MKKPPKKSAAAASAKSPAESAANAASAADAADAAAKDADAKAAAGDSADAASSSAASAQEDGGESGGESRAAKDGDADAESSSDSADPLAKYDAAELRDLYVRAVAEKENIARRAQAEVRKAHDFALSRFAPGVCEARDCLESALAESEGEAGGDAREGLRLALQKLSKAMEDNGVSPVRPDVGASFDANLHEAVGTSGGGARAIAKVMQCGYTLHGRLVRPAIVWLGDPPPDAKDEKDNSAPRRR